MAKESQTKKPFNQAAFDELQAESENSVRKEFYESLSSLPKEFHEVSPRTLSTMFKNELRTSILNDLTSKGIDLNQTFEVSKIMEDKKQKLTENIPQYSISGAPESLIPLLKNEAGYIELGPTGSFKGSVKSYFTEKQGEKGKLAHNPFPQSKQYLSNNPNIAKGLKVFENYIPQLLQINKALPSFRKHNTEIPGQKISKVLELHQKNEAEAKAKNEQRQTLSNISRETHLGKEIVARGLHTPEAIEARGAYNLIFGNSNSTALKGVLADQKGKSFDFTNSANGVNPIVSQSAVSTPETEPTEIPKVSPVKNKNKK